MTTTQEPTTRDIPLSKLVPSEANVRRTGRMNGIEQLAASITAHGLIQCLSVRPLLDDHGKATGKYAVSGGGRRLAALKLLAKRKEIAKNHLVPCIINTGNEEEVSLAENFCRENLHPADQFEAFQRQVTEHGKSIEEIAARFGVTPHVVRQRLRLAAVSPKLMHIYRSGGLTLDQLMAFAITEDHARQEQVHDNLAWNKGPDFIRRALMEAHVRSTDRRAVFVGAEAYEQAGGAIVRDLFSEDGDGYLNDPALLDRLTTDKLAVIAAELQQSEGWKWTQPFIDFPHGHGLRREFPQPVELSAEDKARLEALEAEHDACGEEYDTADDLPHEVQVRLDELQAQLEAFVECQQAFTSDVIARTGAFVTLNHDGSVNITGGFMRPEDDQKVAEEATLHDGGDGASTATTKAEGGNADGKPLSDTLVRDLTAHRTLSLRLALGGNPDVALTAVTHALASQIFYGDNASCLQIRTTVTEMRGFAEGIDDTAAAKALRERHEAWAAELPEEAANLWGFIAALNAERCMKLLAHCVALTVSAVRQPNDREPLRFATADQMAQAVSLDMTAHWQPTARSYLGRVSKAQIVQAVKEAASQDAARRIAGLKKQAMAEAAGKLLAGTGWLPVLLRMPEADEPAFAEAKPRLRAGRPNEAEALAVAAE